MPEQNESKNPNEELMKCPHCGCGRFEAFYTCSYIVEFRRSNSQDKWKWDEIQDELRHVDWVTCLECREDLNLDSFEFSKD